jgi:hypothetical protein
LGETSAGSKRRINEHEDLWIRSKMKKHRWLAFSRKYEERNMPSAGTLPWPNEEKLRFNACKKAKRIFSRV